MRRFDSLEDYTYTVTWTKNGKGWYTAAFKTRDGALEFVAGMLRENEGNIEFTWYAQRLATLCCEDFLDDSVPDVRVRFANPWPCSNNGDDEPDEDEKDEDEKDGDDEALVRRAILDLVEECRTGEGLASNRLMAVLSAADTISRLS